MIRFVPFETHKTIGDYTFIIAGLLVFVFFGLSKETLSLYPAAGRWAMSLFSRKSKTMHLKAVKPPVEVQLTEADTNQ